MRRLFWVAVVLIGSAHAQSIYQYPSTVSARRGSYQTVTAIVAGVSDKTVTWTTTGGTLVGTNPCTSAPCTIGLYSATAGGPYTVTATSNANGSVTKTSSVTFTASPTPATSYPHFGLTPAMETALQAKATGGNTLYQSWRANAISQYNSLLLSDGGGWTFSCPGYTGTPSNPSAFYGPNLPGVYYLFAWMAAVDPGDSTYNWSCYGTTVEHYFMSQFNSGGIVLAQNDWNDNVDYLALSPSYLIGGSSWDSGETALYRQFEVNLIYRVMTTTAGNVGCTSCTFNSSSTYVTSPSPTPGDLMYNQRLMGNNYTDSTYLLLASAALTLTPDDDPANLTNSCSASSTKVCDDWTVADLHAYFTYLTGNYFYKAYLHMEDPIVSWKSLNAFFGNQPTQPTAEGPDGQNHTLGDGRNGEWSEGSWYGPNHIYALLYAFNGIRTAGYDDPLIWGPQMSLGTSSWWDLSNVADLEFLTGFAPQNGGSLPAYSYISTGDSNTYYRVVNDMHTESALMVSDYLQGRSDATALREWPLLNMAFGGPLGTAGGCSGSNCGFTNNISNFSLGTRVVPDMMLYLPAADPTASLPSDPRTALPLDLYNPSFNQHIMARSSWSSNYTLFSYLSPNALIYHEHEYSGRFDVFSNNEYITKGRVTFNDYNPIMSLAYSSNDLQIQNPTGSSCSNLSNDWCNAFAYGGQMWLNYQNGINSLLHSEMPNYVAAIVDNTVNYNGGPFEPGYTDYNGVTGSSRSLVYLRGSNQIVFYDRATASATTPVAQYTITTGTPAITGTRATWPTQSGTQKGCLNSLLPAGAAVSNFGLPSGGGDQAADWEPVSTVKISAGTVSSARFLSTLEWEPTATSCASPSGISSTSGQNFDGALIGTSLVMFARTWPATFTGVTYPASGATAHYVSDLTPGATYAISGAGTPSSGVADTAGVLAFAATGTGNVTVGASSSSPSVTFGTITLGTVGAH